MTVQSPNDPSGGNSRVGSALGSNANTGRQNQSTASDRPTITRINSLLTRSFKVRGSGESVRLFIEGMQKQIPDELKKSFQLLPLDNPSALAISSIIVTKRTIGADQKEHVFFYTMLLEATSRIPGERTEQVGNVSIPIPLVASDALDARMWDAVKQRVAEAFPSRDTVFHNAGAMVVHGTSDPSDESVIHGLLVAAGRALDAHEAQAFNSQPPFSVAWIHSDARVNSKISFNPPQLIDAGGNPVRQDVTVDVVCRVNQGGQQSIHSDELELTKIGGYIDLIFQRPPAPQFHGQIVPPQRYRPRLVITSMRSHLDAETIETRLFGLVAGPLLLSRHMNWAGVYLPRHGIDPKSDTRDIGAIGYEVPLDAQRPNEALGKKVNTRAANFSRADLAELVRTGFWPELVISQDVVELGPDSWLDETFLLAANNNADAIAAILEGANNLSAGKFANHFKGGPVLIDDNNRVHLGFFKAPNGELRDIRELDYVTLLNLTGDKGLQAVIDYSDSFDNQNLHPLVRLDMRQQLLKARFNDNLTINGFARRLTWAPHFLVALANSCAEAGLNIRPENTQLDFAGQGTRGYYDAAAMGLGPQESFGVFSMGGGFTGQGYNYNQPFNTYTYR